MSRFGAWRVAVFAVAGTGLLCMAAWLASRDAPIEPIAVTAVTIGMAVVGATAFSLASVDATHLRWDGQVWRFGSPRVDHDELSVGRLSVAIDLGPWMLIRLDAPAAGLGHRRTWLPIQRRGLEARWHALRCAVYAEPASARPDDSVHGG